MEPKEPSHSWDIISLSTLKDALDDRSIGIEERRQESNASRKELAEATKQSKSAKEKEKALAQLVRRYQVEVDSLTERASTAEDAFRFALSGIHGLVSRGDHADDASEELDRLRKESERWASSAHEVDALRRKCEHLEKELREFEEEAKHIHNQGHTIRKLEETVALLQRELVEREREAAERMAESAVVDKRVSEEAAERMAESAVVDKRKRKGRQGSGSLP